jgi:Fe-S cluster biogenesis protein NfuA
MVDHLEDDDSLSAIARVFLKIMPMCLRDGGSTRTIKINNARRLPE